MNKPLKAPTEEQATAFRQAQEEFPQLRGRTLIGAEDHGTFVRYWVSPVEGEPQCAYPFDA